MQITAKTWNEYITRLSQLNQKAGQLMREYLDQHGTENTDDLIAYAYALITKYGEGSAELAAQMYDALAEAEGVLVPAAEPAATASYSEVARMVNATKRQNPSQLQSGVSRLVKRAGADTTLKNAKRDGAEFAWVPHGDTCAFCITLASRGWQRASEKTLKGDHAEHIHAHCDCEFAIRFNSTTTVAGYEPEKYLKQYRDAGSDVNAMRRIDYAARKDAINAQKRALYAESKLSTDSEKGAIIKVNKVISGHSIPKQSEPNTVIDHLGKDNKVETRTFYGGNGLKKKEITNHDHGFPAKHPYGKHGEHAHDYEWDETGKLKNRTTREITQKEREENRDIL